jgi:hypothetical protein
MRKVFQESLLRHANGEGACPITVVDTSTRVILELLSVQAWLTDAHASTHERFVRWMSLECEATRDQWRMVHPGEPHEDNPALRELLADAETLGLAKEQSPGSEWIAKVPVATVRAGELFEKYSRYRGPGAPAIPAQVGQLMYRLLSGGVHGNAGHVLSTLLPTDEVSGQQPIYTYALSSGTLWRAATVFFLTTFVARSNYAAWLAIDVPAETRRLSLHHLELSVGRLSTGP